MSAATAVPKITSEFHRLDDISWYGVAYKVAQMALQPSYGRLYVCFPLKTVFCVCIAVFGAGSIICATSLSSAVFIAGRAIQGTGAAGIFSGALIMCNYVVSKEKLPIFLSIISSMYITASVTGPTVGGVIASSRSTWRFCFWLNLRESPSVEPDPLDEFLEGID